MGETIGYVVDSASKGYRLIKKSAVPLYTDLFKIALLASVVSFAGLAIAGIIAYLFQKDLLIALMNGEIPDIGMGTIVVLVVAVLITIVVGLLSKAVGSVSYNAVENRTKDKGTGIIAQSQKNLVPIVKYTLLVWAVLLVILLPIMLAVFMGGIGAVIGMCLFPVLALIVYLLFIFFIQFSLYELILARKGVINAMKSSASLVKGNILSVLLLDIGVIIITLATYAGIGIFRMILEFIPAALSLAGDWGVYLGYAIYMVLYTLVSVAISTLSMTIILPIVYYFWKGKRR